VQRDAADDISAVTRQSLPTRMILLLQIVMTFQIKLQWIC